MESGTAIRVSLADFLSLSNIELHAGPVRVSAAFSVFGSGTGSLAGTVEIENSSSLSSVGARPASADLVFPHVAHGGGLFTGLALATGDGEATVTIEVYTAAGSTPKSATFTMAANQYVGRLLSELVPNVTSQIGGYIRVRSNEPIWVWEIYGSAQVLAAGPPL
jgi:hypothetical protein